MRILRLLSFAVVAAGAAAYADVARATIPSATSPTTSVTSTVSGTVQTATQTVTDAQQAAAQPTQTATGAATAVTGTATGTATEAAHTATTQAAQTTQTATGAATAVTGTATGTATEAAHTATAQLAQTTQTAAGAATAVTDTAATTASEAIAGTATAATGTAVTAATTDAVVGTRDSMSAPSGRDPATTSNGSGGAPASSVGETPTSAAPVAATPAATPIPMPTVTHPSTHVRAIGPPPTGVTWHGTFAPVGERTSSPSRGAAAPEPSLPHMPRFPGLGFVITVLSGNGAGGILLFGLLAFAFLLAIPNAVRWLRPALALGLSPAYVAPADRPG